MTPRSRANSLVYFFESRIIDRGALHLHFNEIICQDRYLRFKGVNLVLRAESAD